MTKIDSDIVEFVKQQVFSDAMANHLRELVCRLVELDTAPTSDLAATADRERKFLDFVSQWIASACGNAVQVERPAINSAIGHDDAYSLPGYAADPGGQIPSAEQVYTNRCNLLAIAPGETEKFGALLHAHFDTVSPYFPARIEGGRVYGRGACDNKAQVAVLLLQMQLLYEIQKKLGNRPSMGRVYQFVTDEEIGGNGSLSALRDKRFAGVPVLLHDSSDLGPYCAHRGAVYYRVVLSGGKSDVSALELFPLVVREIEAEGQKIREETHHPLFGPQHVQTCQGRLGPFGQHPGSVCDYVSIGIDVQTNANPERVGMKLVEFLDQAVAKYVKQYGDKTAEQDPATGKRKLERHFRVHLEPGPKHQHFEIEVYGKAGHMAAVAECDNAITKAAFFMSMLLKASREFPQVKATARFIGDPTDGRVVVLEGGQGFTPTHSMSEVQKRIEAAAVRGVQQYCQSRRRQFDPVMVQVGFDRLHNDAYADSPDCPPMQALQGAFEALGRAWPNPLTGWGSSCDARLYHNASHSVAIFGAGSLAAAHGNQEFVEIVDLQQALAVSTLATWAMIR